MFLPYKFAIVTNMRFFFYFKIPIYMYVCVIDDPLIVAIHLFANIFLLYALG